MASSHSLTARRRLCSSRRAREAVLAEGRTEAVRLILAVQECLRRYRAQGWLSRVHVSIRDLMRASSLMAWLASQHLPTRRNLATGAAEPTSFVNPFLPRAPITRADVDDFEFARRQLQAALFTAVATIYYLRLPSEAHVRHEQAAHDLRSMLLAELAEAMPDGTDAHAIEAAFRASVEHLWGYATVPPDLAHTQALKDNFYACVLAANARPTMNLLISGPPGCGKTLAFKLAADNLVGPSESNKELFHSLVRLRVLPYQCSEVTTAGDITALYERAARDQRTLHHGNTRVLVFLDEAGLPRERRQALKATHDALDDGGGVPSVLLSNTTLDAAKTNRCFQVLQSSALANDLEVLVRGLLLDEVHAPCWSRRTRAPAARRWLRGLSRWRRRVSCCSACAASVAPSHAPTTSRQTFAGTTPATSSTCCVCCGAR